MASNTTNSNKSNIMCEEQKNEFIYKDVQDVLESELSCAICRDIYINPLILNCSHSFCKFCVYRWLSKRNGCPECRMIVSFQAENLALRNIINKMVLKSSPEFQSIRSNSLSQRLKAEEEQAKEAQASVILKQPPVGNQQRSRNRESTSSSGDNPSDTMRGVFRIDVISEINYSQPLRTMFDFADSRIDDESDSESDDDVDFEVEVGQDSDEVENSHDEEDNDSRDVTFVDQSDDSSSSEDEMDEDSWTDLDVTGQSNTDEDSHDDDISLEDLSDDDERLNVYGIDGEEDTSSEYPDSSDDDWPQGINVTHPLPDTESECESTSDNSSDSEEDDSMDAERYSNGSTIEYATSDESDDSTTDISFDTTDSSQTESSQGDYSDVIIWAPE